MTMQVDKARLDDGQSFEWKGKTYYRGPLVEYGTFGSSRKISLTPFPSVCPNCGDRSLRSTEGKEGLIRLSDSDRQLLRMIVPSIDQRSREPGDAWNEAAAILWLLIDTTDPIEARAALTRSPE